MMKGSRWPRPGYLHDTVPIHVITALKSSHQTTMLADAFLHPICDEEEMCRLAQRLLATCPEYRGLIFHLDLSPAEIKQKWDDHRISAANCGTWTHLAFEFHLNRCCLLEESVELRMFIKYLSTLDGLSAYRTEWTIYGEDGHLAGSIDFVARTSSGDIVLFDWKRSKSLRSKHSNQFQTMLGPLQHLPDCGGWHDRIQLNCYNLLLEKYYGCNVTAMYVACTHPDNSDKAFVDEVPNLYHETLAVMQDQASRAKERAFLEDPAGGTHISEACRFTNVCLVYALQSLGFPVPLVRSGPFQA
ncbi:unnamed protein product [Polarella glacialis]|uniref:PD-(D/E)XK endonuclease-like domain-containing protein n=2 Tax=Polarella glacialis TaxID=89957 RepID=A0A813DCE4_POLGL|nr:unnamed protein product [Polarella glacialis]